MGRGERREEGGEKGRREGGARGRKERGRRKRGERGENGVNEPSDKTLLLTLKWCVKIPATHYTLCGQ